MAMALRESGKPDEQQRFRLLIAVSKRPSFASGPSGSEGVGFIGFRV